jgi:hypothetical protein
VNLRRAIAELVGGAAGALMVLLLVFGAGWPIWLAVPVGLIIYAASRLIRSDQDNRTDVLRGQQVMAEARARLVAIRRLERQIVRSEISEQVREIVEVGEDVARAIEEDSAWAAAVQLIEQILAPCEALLTGYVRLVHRRVAGAESVIAKTEEHDLAAIRQSLVELYEALNRGHIVELAVMSELVELNRAGIGQGIPRRIDQ